MARHNPPVYYSGHPVQLPDERRGDGTPLSGALAVDLNAGTLPSYGVLVPNLCNDGHDACNGQSRVSEEDQTSRNVATGDHVLCGLSERSPPGHPHRRHQRGTRKRQPARHDPRNPNIPPGTQVATRYDHYALLRLTEQLPGLTPLANAAHAPDMTGAFNLPLPPTQTP